MAKHQRELRSRKTGTLVPEQCTFWRSHSIYSISSSSEFNISQRYSILELAISRHTIHTAVIRQSRLSNFTWPTRDYATGPNVLADMYQWSDVQDLGGTPMP